MIVVLINVQFKAPKQLTQNTLSARRKDFGQD